MDERDGPASGLEIHRHRRRFLRTVGAAGLVGAAGCTALNGDDGNGEDDDGGGGVSEGAIFEVSGLEPSVATIVGDDELEVSATITNAGDAEGTQTIEYRVDGEGVATQSVTLDAREEELVTFEDVDTDDLEGGEYTHGVYTDDDEARGTLTVADLEPPEPDPEAYEDSPALPPEEALGTFELPPGWTIELVASEPLIDSPVDVKWDAKGRMWVVEMPDYMDIVPGDGRGGEPPANYGDWGDAEMSEEEVTGWGDETSDEEPNGAVKVLEDADGDGRMEGATTFAGPLTLSRSISFLDADDALAIAHAGSAVDEPDLFLAADDNGDLVADREQPLVESWVNPIDPEHAPNGLNYTMNNWLYSADSTDRFRYRDGDFVQADTHNRGQWGLAQDNYGRFYANWNASWLHADLIPGNGDHLLRDPSNESSNGVWTDIVSDNTVYPVREVRGTNRSYPGGVEEHRDDGRLATATAVSAPGIYRGDVFPEGLVNQAFVPAPKANCVAQFDIREEASGLDLATEHVVYDNDEWGEQEFLASTDEVFKPVVVKTGPDGALYVVDMYNGIFQHRLFMTDYLAEYYLENDLHEVPPAGRIWRVYPEDAELSEPPALDELEPDELASQLEHANGWVRDTAQRLIVQGGETDAADALREIARESDSPEGRIHALWALHGIGEVDADSVFAAMDVDHSHVQAAAMQTGEALLETDDAADYVDRLVEFADADHLRLVVQAAYSLGEVSDGSLQSQAEETLEGLLEEYDDQYVTDAVHSSPEMDF